MLLPFFPTKKLRRNGKHVLFGVILLVGAVAVYQEIAAITAWSSDTGMNYKHGNSWRTMFNEGVRRDHQPDHMEDSAARRCSYTPQPWKPEYKGKANLHVFEDWCGSSVAELRKNLHYPLYPHSRTTVKNLAVTPQWTNYGLRIFGYLHPFTDGEFVLALSSDDNSEFWLSTDDSPLNLQLLAWVGKTGSEWTAPGEFEKYASQTSRPIRLFAQRRYFFEVIHKQNDKGTDHVEVAWKLLDQSFRFMVIESKDISLYVDESALLMSDVAHIPQTAASYQHTPTKQDNAAADILREDPRDTFYQVPLINSKFLQGVLPDCLYKPSYTVKDFHLLRYQGLQFVHMSYIYPYDYTRLTHMETEDSCFYPESSYYKKMFGFSRYMRLDHSDMQGNRDAVRDFGFHGRKLVPDEEEVYNEAYQREKESRPDQIDDTLLLDNGYLYNDYTQRRGRKLFSLVMQETNNTLNSSYIRQNIDTLNRRTGQDSVPAPQPKPQKPAEPMLSVTTQVSKHRLHMQQKRTELTVDGPAKKVKRVKPKQKRPAKRRMIKSVKTTVTPGAANPQTPVDGDQLKVKGRPVVPSEQLTSKQSLHKGNHTQIQKPKRSKRQPSGRDTPLPIKPTASKKVMSLTRQTEQQPAANTFFTVPIFHEFYNRAENRRVTKDGERDSLWGPRGDFEDDEDITPAPVFDTEINWNQTFQVSHLDLQAERSDSIDLQCNISGNLRLQSRDALPMVKAFMDRLNEKHHGEFTLARVINVVKRVDGYQGSRYLLELELRRPNGQLVRLSQYIYVLTGLSGRRSRDFGFQQPKAEPVLCNPVGFHWNPVATVHFIVPVKNQARWVQQLIADMETLFRETRDTNFNLIITDYSSTDMDVRKALEKSSLPRYQYVKLRGNFERSAGLQAGIDLVDDNHSIVFLCDLHIHIPPSIIDTIRKHCVEGHMAFAPIVMRLNCGATPLEARGYWEVNGFGLLGIYKSDLDAVGGMNTKEFRDRWGGEDWELLDRIFQAGLEVERIFLRNFYHHYHSKRGMWNRQVIPSHR
uniref:Beta-1,4-N-acetylgalactosaminyltransferase n=1 Tax=Monopterus albus TaxID=43700 RepID=A0A3Q3J7E0_MONAL|nr:beta-1,4-N-acetylgalactosaminyltransferase 3-like [Monopterus albus]